MTYVVPIASVFSEGVAGWDAASNQYISVLYEWYEGTLVAGAILFDHANGQPTPSCAATLAKNVDDRYPPNGVHPHQRTLWSACEPLITQVTIP